jgi:hypothetical protein
MSHGASFFACTVAHIQERVYYDSQCYRYKESFNAAQAAIMEEYNAMKRVSSLVIVRHHDG